MLQKSGKIKVGTLFLKRVYQVNALGYLGQSIGKQLVYKYTTLFGRFRYGCSHDFKFAGTSFKFRKILD